MLTADVGVVNAVILIHSLADHFFRIDDLRQVYSARGISVPEFTMPTTAPALRRQFGYVVEGAGGYSPTVDLQLLTDELMIGSIRACVAISRKHRSPRPGFALMPDSDRSAMPPTLAA